MERKSVEVRKGQFPGKLDREAFRQRFEENFYDPRFDAERDAIARIEEIAWHNYSDARKAPMTSKAGPGSPIPTTTCRSNGSDARPADRAQQRQAGPGDALARARDLRLAAQRRHLPRRDLEELAARDDRARDAAAQPGSRPTSST